MIEPSVDHCVKFYFVKLQCFTAQLVASYVIIWKAISTKRNCNFISSIWIKSCNCYFLSKCFGKKNYNQHFVHTLTLCTYITLYMFMFFLTIHSMVMLQGKEVCGQNECSENAPYWLVHELWRVPFPCNVPFLTMWGNVLPHLTWVRLNSSALCLSNL